MDYQLLILMRSDLARKYSIVNNKIADKTTNKVATASMVGLICSLSPENICLGIVFCSGPAKNSATTTSSNEVTKANNAPEITPGLISGIMILTKV